MDFQLIKSGKDKPQIIHDGYRMMFNKGPQGSNNTRYFICTKRYTDNCKATLGTTGDLDGSIALKFHKKEHNHERDVPANIVSSSLHQFREAVKNNPDCSAKTVFKDITTEALDSVSTPDKLNLAKKLPVYRSGKA